MHLVHQVDFAVLLSELVLGVHQDETLAGCYLGSALENGPGIFLKLFIIQYQLSAKFIDFLRVSYFRLFKR